MKLVKIRHFAKSIIEEEIELTLKLQNSNCLQCYPLFCSLAAIPLKVISFLAGNNCATDCESYRPPREVFYGLLESVKKCTVRKENFLRRWSQSKVCVGGAKNHATHIRPISFDRESNSLSNGMKIFWKK